VSFTAGVDFSQKAAFPASWKFSLKSTVFIDAPGAKRANWRGFAVRRMGSAVSAG